MGRPKLSLNNEDSAVLSLRVPRSWMWSLKTLETVNHKQHDLVRFAIWDYLKKHSALPNDNDLPVKEKVSKKKHHTLSSSWRLK